MTTYDNLSVVDYRSLKDTNRIQYSSAQNSTTSSPARLLGCLSTTSPCGAPAGAERCTDAEAADAEAAPGNEDEAAGLARVHCEEEEQQDGG